MTKETKKDGYTPQPFGGVDPSSVFDYNLRIYIPKEEFEASQRQTREAFSATETSDNVPNSSATAMTVKRK